MKRINRKKLNNKGFTLIELLAVVVILAIVMGLTGTAILNSINNSRKSTIYSAAQNAANMLNTWVTEDTMTTIDNQKKLGDTFISKSQTGAWICLGNANIKTINNADGDDTKSANLVTALGFSSNDIVIDDTGAAEFVKENLDESVGTIKDPSCSALRYNRSIGGYELVLVAKSGGKFYVSSDPNHFAYSRAHGPNMANID